MLTSGRRLHGIASGSCSSVQPPSRLAATAPASRGGPWHGAKPYGFAKAAPTRQQRRPPPVAETGRSCWGSGQQDTSALHDVDAGCRNPDRWHCEAMTVGFFLSPENFFQKIPKKVKGICVSCIIESETAKIQHKTARYINAAGVRISRTALLHAIYYGGS